MANKTYRRLAWIAAILALIVIMVGAFTRLSDAGLGCPDWPGCYGQLTAPESSHAITAAEQAFPGHVIETGKAAIEMGHRYIAGILGILIFILGIWGIKRAQDWRLSRTLLTIMMLVVIFQALLGMWTVTLKLMPLVVMGHLLGGFATVSLLWWTVLKSNGYYQHLSREALSERLRPWAIFAFIMLILQIALGAWTSTNYAALACRSLPFCNAHTAQSWDVANAFQWWVPFDQLSMAAKQTIQMCHRIGAVIVLLIVGGIALRMLASAQDVRLKRLGVVLLFVLLLQIILGLANVMFALPLAVAVAHNGVAAILLLTLLTVIYAVKKQHSLFK